ncbi:MAG TPA: ATP synthase subunit I [Anaerolineaceae bacterium]|nr:hypothetical protein [Chloroflexota bacterium]HNY83488.1 ATP synthase subunit I [Anaerolineaceae bacterium]
MNPLLSKVLFSLLWAGLGTLSAWLSFISLRKSAEAISPDMEESMSQLPKMMTGRMVRLILVGVAIYIALRMGAIYAIVFVAALTITTWILVVRMNRQLKRSSAAKDEGFLP